MNSQGSVALTVVEELCSAALSAQISLREFEALWPDIAKLDLLDSIRSDLEDGISHTPGSLVTGRVKYDEWRQSFEYFRIELDREIVKRLIIGTDINQLAKMREYAIDNWSRGTDAKKVVRRFGSHEPS